MTIKTAYIRTRTEDGQQRDIELRIATDATYDENQNRIELAVKREFDPTAQLGTRLGEAEENGEADRETD